MKIAKQSVDLINWMGSDLSVVNAARVSFAKESDWEVTYHEEVVTDSCTLVNWPEEKLSEKDQKLISYLATHNHWSPFAHAFLSFRIKTPIFVARQLVKHQVGLAWNEVSRRYVDEEPEFYFPDVWHKRPDASIKQGSGEPHEQQSPEFSDDHHHVNPYTLTDDALSLYLTMVKEGYAPEEARMVLPLNTMTEWILSGSLMAFARVCKLRLDPHSQGATREVAKMINDLIPKEFEHSWKALVQ